MQTFSMFFSEDAGDKFRAMSDEQFADWKKNNPGAAAKADQMRKDAKGSAIVKSGTSSSNYKQVLANKAKQIAAEKAKQAGSALVKKGKETIANKIRKKDMGKWSQGIKNSPKQLKAGEKDRFDNRQDEKQNTGKGGTDTAYAGGKYPKVQNPDAKMKGMKKMKKDQEDAKRKKDKEDGFVGGVKKSLGGDYFHSDDDKRRAARNQLGQGVAGFLARRLRSSVKGGVESSSAQDLGSV
ncbi:hypothetical protein SCREM2_gp136 [Synechococcus phage S-CREM2]|nr:hypothetical protein SCREM2_gp136 [Synechococcus phage S-CREM2]